MGSGATKGQSETDGDLDFEKELAAAGVRRVDKIPDEDDDFLRWIITDEHREAILKVDRSFKILFEGSPEEAFIKHAKVVVSFPGVHGTGWNMLMERAKLKNSLATTCVFLPDKDAPGFGDHVLDPKRDARGHAGGVPKEACHCYHLYGKAEPWGCKWYDMWMRKTRMAAEKDCDLYVVMKGDGGLGNSQQGEVRFLEKELGKPFEKLSLLKFANMAARDAYERGQLNVLREKPGGGSGAGKT